eukprot:scaffold2683_cov84-Amphora_coffeaeformis.AAC.1
MDSENDACSNRPPTAYRPASNQTKSSINDVSNVPTSDCYMSLQGGVYNLTEFAKYHTGGAFKITTQCGKDGTRTCRCGRTL